MTRLVLGALRLLGRVMYAVGAARLVLALKPRRPRILLYHACEPTETGFTAGLRSNTSPAAFERQLDFLRRYYTLTDIDTAVGPDRPDRAVAITFDDGYRSVYEHAFPILQEKGATATVYIISEAIGDSTMVWVNALNQLLAEGGAGVGLVTRRLGRGEGEVDGVLSEVIASVPQGEIPGLVQDVADAEGVDLVAQAAGADLFLTEVQILEMAEAGLRFGNHTMTHPNLSLCSSAEARDQVRGAHQRVSRLPGFTPSFAYPFGFLSDEARREAVSLGYRSLMQVGGVNSPVDPLALARQPVAEHSPGALFAEMEFVEPFKAWVRRVGRRA
jgi:peptidoglycan/xylan/chitin deacetylase (PgdA/CDA1 family)